MWKPHTSAVPTASSPGASRSTGGALGAAAGAGAGAGFERQAAQSASATEKSRVRDTRIARSLLQNRAPGIDARRNVRGDDIERDQVLGACGRRRAGGRAG